MEAKLIVRLHHFGMMVEDVEKQVKVFESLGFKVVMRFSYDAIGAKAAMLNKDGAGVELWQMNDPENEMAKKIKKHSAFESDDLENDVKALLDSGYELAIPIRSGNVVKRYAYVSDDLGNYIELIELLLLQ
jgi:catechol 2,3-dioxygenase-like lactoylglutathione lyase family enzyme